MAKFAKIIQENNENFLIKKFIRLFRRKIADKGKSRFSFVLTGGKSPIKLYKRLAKNNKIPWKKIDFFIGDERYVKESSKHSNIKMCKKYLLNKIKISNSQIYKISTNKKSIKKNAQDYENKIKKYFSNKKAIYKSGYKSSVAKKSEVNKFLSFIINKLDKKGFLQPDHKRKSMIRNINNIFHRLNLSEQEIRILLGIFSTLNEFNKKS